MEVITNNGLIDEIRVKDGLILRVEKYEIRYEKRCEKVKVEIDKKDLGRVTGKGMTEFKQVKKDIVNENGEVVFNKGDYIRKPWHEKYQWEKVNILSDPKDYYIELKCAGGSIGGYSNKFASVIKEVQSIINERYGI